MLAVCPPLIHKIRFWFSSWNPIPASGRSQPPGIESWGLLCAGSRRSLVKKDVSYRESRPSDLAWQLPLSALRRPSKNLGGWQSSARSSRSGRYSRRHNLALIGHSDPNRNQSTLTRLIDCSGILRYRSGNWRMVQNTTPSPRTVQPNSAVLKVLLICAT